jgi:hypothetical protein
LLMRRDDNVATPSGSEIADDAGLEIQEWIHFAPRYSS